MIHDWLYPDMQNKAYRGPPMGLMHFLILVSAAGPGTNPPQIQRDIFMFIKTISKMVKQNRKDKKNFFLNICKDSPTSFSISYLNIHCCKSTFIMYS